MQDTLIKIIETTVEKVNFASDKLTTKRIEKDEQKQILAFNFYPRDVAHTFDTILKKVKDVIPYKKGEVIQYQVRSGQILDQGYSSFSILNAFIFEIYMYESESFFYIRLLHEKSPEGMEWISLDLDSIQRSLWFKD